MLVKKEVFPIVKLPLTVFNFGKTILVKALVNSKLILPVTSFKQYNANKSVIVELS